MKDSRAIFSFQVRHLVQKITLVAAVCMMAITNIACSTPAVPDKESDPKELAWWAYQECLESLSPYQSTSVCDDVGRARNRSRSSYSGKAFIAGGQGQKVQDLSQQFTIGYKEFLNQLDDETLAQMTLEWQEISASAQ